VLIWTILVISVLGAVYVIWHYLQGMRSVDWPQTKGVIVQSALERISGSKHVIRVYYRYEVSGKPWFSRRLKMTLSNLVDDDEVEGILHCYPKDKEVKVRYHPIFNGVAVLKPGATGLGLHLFLAYCSLCFL
jgi:hypothetical protein